MTPDFASLGRFFGFAFPVLVFGCSSGPESAAPSTTPGNELLAAPPNDAGFQLELAVDVAPGVEGTWCQYFVLPDQPHDIGRYESRYTPISHHLIVFETPRTAEDPATALGIFDC